MKKHILTTICMVASLAVKAQYVSLHNGEIERLKTIIENDQNIKALFTPYLITAAKAVNDLPNPVETIRSQGLLAGDPVKTASLKAVEDCRKIYALALCYRLYNSKGYLEKAQEFLTAWAKMNKANGDPIDETKLDELIAGYDLVRNTIKQKHRIMIDSWLDGIAQAEIKSEFAQGGRTTAKNNWNSHRIKIITQIAYTIHAPKYYQTIKEELEKQLAQNLYPDGSGFDFEERDALHYHVYTLEPLLLSAITINRADGSDYYNFISQNTSSIKKSTIFLADYVSGERTHEEFVKSTVEFDRTRAANGEKGYEAGALFKPRSGLVALSLATYFEPAYLNLIRKVGGDQYYNWQLVLNRVREKAR